MEKFYQRLKRWSLFAMLFFVGILLLWVIIYIIIQTFDYTIFGGFTGNLFYAMIAGIIVILAALVILNVAVNLNLISDHLAGKDKTVKEAKLSWKGIAFTVGGVSFLILFIGLTLHFINQENTRITIKQIQTELDQFKGAFAPKLQEIAGNVQAEQNLQKILANLNVMAVQTTKMNDAEIIFPKIIDGALVLLSINRDTDTKIDPDALSPISECLVEISEKEQIDYIKSVYETGKGEDKMFVKRPLITIYSPVFYNGKLAYFLYSTYNEIQGLYMKGKY
ncbi:MAG: hypothetical protein A2Y33_01655 [Spirochaetes bacterium GWF1_51_8]|nr:MAG: hypothetical protein A2Y33_01655 [Spirochaetes bacterium GWF1_51_8]